MVKINLLKNNLYWKCNYCKFILGNVEDMKRQKWEWRHGLPVCPKCGTSAYAKLITIY